MTIKITPEVKAALNSFKNKTAIANGYKVYSALYLRSIYTNRDQYFYVPSTYLRSVNARYSRYIKKFIEVGIIKYYQRIDPGIGGIPDKVTKYYDTNKGICMKYKCTSSN